MPEVATGWMIWLDQQSVQVVGPEVEAVVSFDDGERASLELPSLVSELTQLGAMETSGAARSELPGRSLGDAITAPWDRPSEPEVIWTAEEVMRLPTRIGEAARRAAIHAFVGGLCPDARLFAYAALTRGGGEVRGDRPPRDRLLAAVDQLGPVDEITGCALEQPEQAWRVRPEGLGELDCSGAHRLGPIVRIKGSSSLVEDGLPEIEFTVAEIGESNLSSPAPEVGRRVQGVASGELGELIARAEGAERLAARVANVPGGSSGVAAHLDVAAARDAALAELIERDAFMWTWIQQLSRERIAPASAPPQARRWSEVLSSKGWVCHWINLTLESWPVILCCLVHDRLGLQLGAACREDAAAALMRATEEAAILALRFDRSGQRAPFPNEVVQPVDHLLLHSDPAIARVTSVLYRSEETTELDDVCGTSDPIAGLATIGVSPVFTEIGSTQSRPFTVIRAEAPGLLPITFGFGQEPLELELAGSPRLNPAGRSLGRAINTAELAFPVPHPFA